MVSDSKPTKTTNLGQRNLRASIRNALLASTALVGAQCVYAAEGAADSDGRVLEEIIVRGIAKALRPTDQSSATGMQMSLLETPQAVSVIDGAFFEFTGSKDVYGAAQFLPGIERRGEGFGANFLVIRGQKQQGLGRINGHQFNAFGEFAGNTFDKEAFERVEIVRGPASVVYNTGSFGGEVNQVSKRPEEEFGVTANLEAGSYDHVRGSIDVTGSLTEDGKLRARLVAVYQEWGTQYDNPKKVEHDKYVVSPSLAYDFGDDTTLNVFGYFSEIDGNPYDGVPMVRRADGTLALPDFPKDNYYGDPNTSSNDTEQKFIYADLVHGLANGWSLKASASLIDAETDVSYSYGFGPSWPATEVPNGGYEWSVYSYDSIRGGEAFTANLSLTGGFEALGREHQFFTQIEFQKSTDDGKDDLLTYAGLGIMNSLLPGRVTSPNLGTSSFGLGYPSTAAALVGFDDGGFAILNRDQLAPRRINKNNFEAFRASVQVNFQLTDNLSALLGALVENNEVSQNNVLEGGVPGLGLQERSDTEVVPRVSVSYSFGDDDSLAKVVSYASYTEGFKANVGSFVGIDFEDVPPQEMEQFEIGVKAEFFDGAVAMNVAWYDQELTNESNGVENPDSPNFFDRQLSGKQENSGVEIEFFGELLPGWNVSAFATFSDAQQIDGDLERDLVGNPDKKFGIQSSYEFLEGPLTGLRVGGGVVRNGEYEMFDIGQSESFIHDAYTVVNASIAYAISDSLEINFTGQNIFDEEYFISQQASTGFSIQRGQPKTFLIGITGRY